MPNTFTVLFLIAIVVLFVSSIILFCNSSRKRNKQDESGDIQVVKQEKCRIVGLPSRKSLMTVLPGNKVSMIFDTEKAVLKGNKLRTALGCRKIFNSVQYLCISRPQYNRSCSLTTITSVWNYLFSSIGNGTLPPLSQEEVISLIGFEKPFEDICFGKLTSNDTDSFWFQELCSLLKTRGKSSIIWKVQGKNQTTRSKEEVIEIIREGLASKNTTFVYHMHRHVSPIVGIDEAPLSPEMAYSTKLKPNEKNTWLLIGDVSQTKAPIFSIQIDDIERDLSTIPPEYIDARCLARGVQYADDFNVNPNCIIKYERLD